MWLWGWGRFRVLWQCVSVIWQRKHAAAVVCTKRVKQQEASGKRNLSALLSDDHS